MDSDEALIIGIVLGLILGAMLAYMLVKEKPVSVMFDRDEEGRVTAIHYVPQ